VIHPCEPQALFPGLPQVFYPFAFLMLLQSPPNAAELAAMVSDGNRQSRESIRTISLVAHHHAIPIPGRPPTVPGSDEDQERRFSVKWVQDGDTFQSSQNEKDGTSFEELQTGGIHKSLATFPRSNGKAAHSAALGPAGGRSAFGMWVDALFLVSDKKHAPMYELVGSKQLSTIESTIDDHHDTVYKAAIHESSSRRELWFSSKYNFLVTKSIYYGPDGVLAAEREVTSFQECRPGIFFPKRVIQRETWNGSSYLIWETTFDQVRINTVIDHRVFDLPIPAGTPVEDSLRGISYISDENEEPRGGMTGPVLPNSSTQIDFPTGHPARPRSYLMPLVVGIAAISACLLVYWIIRHKLQGLRART
jgi:hypothetical protein